MTLPLVLVTGTYLRLIVHFVFFV